MKAFVLSGGGSKGSYQIGVWKALRKMHIKFDIVTGTSVGALNGALITQNTYHKAVKIWKNINLKLLFGSENIKGIDQNNTLNLYKMYGNNFLKHGGMEVKNLENLIDKTLQKEKFYHSPINYGLITFNLTQKKAVAIEKKGIPKEKLTDYLIASASCYPAFKKKEIDGIKYIDGGIIDNLPINLAIKMGATDIIAVDLRAPGIKQIPTKKANITVIKPNNKLTNFLKFDKDGAKRNIKLGFNDTMKKFGKLEGKKYTFKKNHITKNKKEIIDTYKYIILQVLNTKKLAEEFTKSTKLTANLENLSNQFFLKIMEETGKSLKIEETKIYSYKTFNRIIKKQLKKELKTKKKKNKIKKSAVELYQEIKKGNYTKLKKQAFLYPIEFLKAVYLFTICEG